MPCYDTQREEEYEFIKHIDKYIPYEDAAEKNEINDNPEVDYSFISSHINSEKQQELTNMFKKFVYLANSLFHRDGQNISNDDYNYLNYRLNYQINKTDPDKFCVQTFYQEFTIKNRNSQWKNLRSKIHDIDEKKLENMNVLYTLYKNYNEITKTISSYHQVENLMKYATNCVNQYKQITNICPANDANFCTALKSFKEKYEDINLCNLQLIEWKKEKLPPLTGEDGTMIKDCSHPEKASENKLSSPPEVHPDGDEVTPYIDIHSITIGTVAIIGISFICFILYRFTSFGTWLHSRISKNENVLENLSEEMNHWSHAYKYDNTDSENISYNIAYNSV
ncbi:PIR Superfamily Protein [Plasmodium ovale wallikeri]|uniref:PIR Superfamily Protein n=1 Tax=Plasmodium ovale wallikeri TaxID=864142 RepID=A0A1A9ARC0_PLAOA|nr:PIR Superfamily Protein [Plasmodium ovale wallikeri]